MLIITHQRPILRAAANWALIAFTCATGGLGSRTAEAASPARDVDARPAHGRSVALHPTDPRVSLVRAAVAMGFGRETITTLSPITAREASAVLAEAGAALRDIPDADGLLLDPAGDAPGAMWPSPGAEALAERGLHVSEASLMLGGADVFSGLRGIRRFADGDRVEEGVFARGTVTADAVLAPWAHVAAGTRLAAGRTVTRVYWPHAVLTLHAAGARVTIGRESRWWGPGLLNDVLLTTNAFPTDAVEVATEGSRHVPFGLGVYRASVFLGYLDDANRPTPYPLLFGHRLAWRPLAWLEIGAGRTIMLGGAGRTERYSPRSLWDIFLGYGENDVSYTGFKDTDQKVGFDATVTLDRALAWVPHLLGARAFYRYAGDDSFDGVLPTRVAQHYGGTFIFPRIRLDVEILDDVASGIWYWNNEYPAGYTYHGDFLATDLGWDAKSGRLRTSVALARDLGVRGELFIDSRGYLFVQGEGLRPIDGTDRSTAVEWALALTKRLPSGVRTTLEYRNRQTDGFTFADDRHRARHLVQLSVRLIGD